MFIFSIVIILIIVVVNIITMDKVSRIYKHMRSRSKVVLQKFPTIFL